MTTEQDIEKIKQSTDKPNREQETIIPAFQNPDTCVFCTNKSYDSLFYLVYRLAYKYKTGKETPKQDKETCIHHSDDWLKHSLRSAGFVWSALTDHGKKPMTYGEAEDIMKNKELREKLLKKKYDEDKNYSSAMALYLPNWSKAKTKKRYNNAFDIEDDILIQNEIIRNKIKIYYNKAIEVLSNFDNEN